MITNIEWAIGGYEEENNTGYTSLHTFDMKDIVEITGLNPSESIYAFSTTPNVDGGIYNASRTVQKRISITYRLQSQRERLEDRMLRASRAFPQHIKGCLVFYDIKDNPSPYRFSAKDKFLLNTYVESVDYNIFQKDIYCTVGFVSEDSYFYSRKERIPFTYTSGDYSDGITFSSNGVRGTGAYINISLAPQQSIWSYKLPTQASFSNWQTITIDRNISRLVLDTNLKTIYASYSGNNLINYINKLPLNFWWYKQFNYIVNPLRIDKTNVSFNGNSYVEYRNEYLGVY